MVLIIETHDNKVYEVEVSTYDAVTLNNELNNHEINTVVIGDIVISRINVKSVVPRIIENI